MYNTKAQRNKKGHIISRQYQSKDLPNTRIQPDRRWFGNTRVIGQKQLDQFRQDMAGRVNDPYAVLVKGRQLPLSLLEDPEKGSGRGAKAARVNLVQTQPFSSTFGGKKTRKRPKLAVESYEDLLSMAESGEEK
jgi:nuclear GTP-binding protein